MSASPEPEKGHIAQLFGRDSLYMLMWAVQIIGAALLTPITTRVLGLPEFGTITSANAVMQVLFVFAGLGLQTAVQREYSTFENPRGAHQLILAALVITAGFSAAAWFTVPFWAGALEMGDEQTALRWAVLWAGSSALTTISLGLLRSLDKLLMFSAVSFLQAVVAEALALGLVKFYRPTAEVFLGGQVAAQFVAALLGLVVAPPALLLWRDRHVLDRALRFALPLVPAALSTFVLSVSDRLVVEAQLGSAEVARYQVAYNVASMPMLLLSVLNSAWMPRFFGIADESERRGVLASSRDALYRLMLPVVVGFACGAPLVLRIWAPASYHPARLHFVVCIVLITAIPYAGQLAVTRTLMADGRTGAAAIGTLLAAVLNVGLNLALVPRFGLEGCAFATLAAYVFLYVALEAFGRGARVPPSPAVLKIQLAGAAALALASAWVSENALTLSLRAIAGAATLVWFVRVLRTIGTENRETEERTRPVHAEVLMVAATIEMSGIIPERRRGERRAVPATPREDERRFDDRRLTGKHWSRPPVGEDHLEGPR
ncbi:lipopolysaccharide biosynthesis protein [Paractinoplanes rhizophilus]|jgi:O-antigen/teichoic acid export membrane protein|uniref:Lipopolysaccharide biosynthesis protein n=1 Tax=Paractinoplanes rhizophilus TaxID=1416877 RepID=A0ABW2HLQ0_9ACTN|nr:oligosaccharide flippase family protein [Actinoplanes sp.]